MSVKLILSVIGIGGIFASLNEPQSIAKTIALILCLGCLAVGSFLYYKDSKKKKK